MARPKFKSGKDNINYLHGMTGKPFHTAWIGMRQRCTNKNSADYSNYGGRGITYDQRWESFANFYADMFSLWEDGLTLDRIDVNGNYTKSNCRFVNRVVQANNRRNTHLFDYAGKSLTLTNWAKHLSKKRSTLAQRYYVLDWSVEKTLIT